MASGWARDGAVQEQIDASVEDAVKLARSRLLFQTLAAKQFLVFAYVSTVRLRTTKSSQLSLALIDVEAKIVS